MITIEQIDEFRKRTHSSYEDAKFFLEKNNGDILDAIIDFERTKTGKGYSYQAKKQKNEFGERFAEILQKGFDTKVIVEDKGSILFTIPVILLILLIPLWVFALLFFILLSTLGYKFSIRDEKSRNVNVNSIFQNINNKMKDKEVKKDNTKDQQSKDHGNSETQVTKNSSSQVPMRTETDLTTEPENQVSKNDPDEEEGYNEYTIE